jgi:hypothetical protein
MARSIITVSTSGSFKNIEGFFERTERKNLCKMLEKYGKQGVELLAAKTPVDTGVTADSWSYEITQRRGNVSIFWKNSALTENGIPIVVLIRFGHATRDGGFVEANDFVEPTVQKLFQKMADEIWKEVTEA